MMFLAFLALFPLTGSAQSKVTHAPSLYIMIYDIHIPDHAKYDCEIRFVSPFIFKYTGHLADGIISTAVSDGKTVWHYASTMDKAYVFTDKYNFKQASAKLGDSEAAAKLFSIATTGFPPLFLMNSAIITPLRMNAAAHKPEIVTIDSKKYTQFTIASDRGVSARLRYNDVGILSEYTAARSEKELIRITLKKCEIKSVRQSEIDELVKYPSNVPFMDKSGSIIIN